MANLSFDNPKSDIVIYQSENGEALLPDVGKETAAKEGSR